MAVGMQVEQVAVQVQENGGKVAGFRRRDKDEKQFADRGYGADSRGRAAGLKATVARRSRVFSYSGGQTAGLE